MSLMMMLARLNNKLGPSTEGVRQKNGFDQIRPALEHIRDNFANPTKIAQIASVCHMSESHFRRLFEENMGMTPVDYLNQVRIKKACDMIRKTGYSMEEIAVKVGFSTTSTFNRNFKRIVGTSRITGKSHRRILKPDWQISIYWWKRLVNIRCEMHRRICHAMHDVHLSKNAEGILEYEKEKKNHMCG